MPLSSQILTEYNEQRLCGPRPLVCYAPFTALYLGMDGEVSPCCYNRYKKEYLLGKYPGNSLHDIWFGKQLQKIREHIQANDLNFGCDFCREDMESGNYRAVKSSLYDFTRLNEHKYPSRMDFELDNTCNLECIMCEPKYSSSIQKKQHKKNETAVPYGQDFLSQLAEFIPHLDYCCFLGGEPFLIDIYYDIWETLTARNPDCSIIVQTNGTVLNDRVRKLLDRGKFTLSVSLDALNKQTYEKIRTGARFETILKNLEYFKEYSKRKKTQLYITACLMQQNWQEFAGLVEYCNTGNILLSFHKVIALENCSLQDLDSATLKSISENYAKVELPELTKIQGLNKISGQNMINYVQEWHRQAQQISSDKTLKNI